MVAISDLKSIVSYLFLGRDMMLAVQTISKVHRAKKLSPLGKKLSQFWKCEENFQLVLFLNGIMVRLVACTSGYSKVDPKTSLLIGSNSGARTSRRQQPKMGRVASVRIFLASGHTTSPTFVMTRL